MAVYTPVDRDTLIDLLATFALGELVHHEAIPVGAENTNYFVTTSRGRYVLTLYERAGGDEIPPILAMMAFLARHGLPAPRPLPNRRGETLVELCGRPATLVECLDGTSTMDPTPIQCVAVGRMLGRMHCVGCGFPRLRTNPRGAAWRRESAAALLPELPAEEAEALRREVLFHEGQPEFALPQGLIHADLFRDNVLFEGDRVTGLVDFHYACGDSLLLDIAITANDWCTDNRGGWVAPRIAALFDGYQQERALGWAEMEAWPAVVRAAALRFWLSRLLDRHLPTSPNDAYRKDPDEYRRLLLRRIDDGEDSAGFLA